MEPQTTQRPLVVEKCPTPVCPLKAPSMNAKIQGGKIQDLDWLHPVHLWLERESSFYICNHGIVYGCYLYHEFHETCHSVTFLFLEKSLQTML